MFFFFCCFFGLIYESRKRFLETVLCKHADSKIQKIQSVQTFLYTSEYIANPKNKNHLKLIRQVAYSIGLTYTMLES